MTVAETRRGRRAKFSEREVHDRLVDFAIVEVDRHGVTYGLDCVRLDRLVVIAKVPRGAGYSTFSDESGSRSPQENLRRAVVLRLLRDTPAKNVEATREAAMGFLKGVSETLRLGSRELRRQTQVEMIDAICRFNHENLQSTRWQIYRSLVVTASTNPDEDEEILDAIECGEQRLVDSYAALFEELAEAIGLMLRGTLTHKQFAMSVIAFNEGLSNRAARQFQEQSTNLPGSAVSTFLFALGAKALADEYYELTDLDKK